MNILDEKLQEKEHITINIVGDSITHGLNHCTAEETYVAVFAGLLAEKYDAYTVRRYDGVFTDPLGNMDYFEGPFIVQKGTAGIIDVIRNGIGGNTVKRAYNRITDFTGLLPNEMIADITIMMFGINDALKSDSAKYVTADVFKQQYKSLIEEVKRRDSKTVIILMSATTNDQNIESYCRKTAEIAEEEGLFFIDQHKMWMEHYCADAPNYGHGDWLSNCPGDACHPTPLGAKKIAEYMFDCLIQQIVATSNS